MTITPIVTLSFCQAVLPRAITSVQFTKPGDPKSFDGKAVYRLVQQKTIYGLLDCMKGDIGIKWE